MSLFRPRYAAGQVVHVQGVPVRLKVDARARRVSLRIDAARGEAVAVAPDERRLAAAAAFAMERAGWLAERVARRPAPRPFAPGLGIPLRGGTATLEATGTASAARLTADADRVVIRSGGEGEAFARRVERLLRAEARRDLLSRTEIHAAALGRAAPTVAIGDPRSRWGSCTPGREAIRYSWRLVMAPPDILDYVAAHEVAHLVHADHSPRFWAVVERLIGDPRPRRSWLRSEGPGLHAWGARAQ